MWYSLWNISTIVNIFSWLISYKQNDQKTFHSTLYTNNDILFFNQDPNNVISCCNEMSILRVDLNNVKIGDANYEEHEKLLDWYKKIGKDGTLKK